MQEKTDNELMRLAAEEDRGAFEVLVLRYYREAMRAAERMVHDWMLSQDIVQDCFADIYVHRGRYRADYSFRTYLYALVKHKSIDYLRKVGRRELLCDGTERDWLEAQPDAEGSPEEQFIRRERTREVAERIEGLPEVQRKALYLYAVKGKSYREIAEMLQKSVPQVKIAIHRARKRLSKEAGDV